MSNIRNNHPRDLQGDSSSNKRWCAVLRSRGIGTLIEEAADCRNYAMLNGPCERIESKFENRIPFTLSLAHTVQCCLCCNVSDAMLSHQVDDGGAVHTVQ